MNETENTIDRENLLFTMTRFSAVLAEFNKETHNG